MKSLFIRWRNTIIVFMTDLLMAIISLAASFKLSSDLFSRSTALNLSVLILFLQCAVFFYCKLYRGIWRFASIPDLIRILRAVLLGTLLVSLLFLFSFKIMPFSMLMIYALMLTCLLSGPRVLFRWSRDYKHLFKQTQRILIVGAGNAGESVVRDLLRYHNKIYSPVAFVDDDKIKCGRDIHGIRVMGTIQDIPTVSKKLHIELILIAIPSATSQNMRKIVFQCEKANLPFRTLPGLRDITNGRVSLNTLRQVLLEDLLGREQAKLDWSKIKNIINKKTILITGGGGSIGYELSRQILLQSPSHVIIVDHNEYNLYNVEMEMKKNFSKIELHCLLCNITDKISITAIFDQFKPNLVFHTAAYKHVPLLEKQLRIAALNNIAGTRQLADLACHYKVEKFILISTDKAVNPANVMGASKRAAELYCQNLNFHSDTKFITVRFGNVLDSTGSVLPLFRKQLAHGGPLTVTHPDISRYFMTIPEASQLILQSASMGKGGEIFILDMGEPIKIRFLAEQMIKLSGKELGSDIEIQYIGLRPGEKLHEELFYEQENLTQTTHHKIRQASAKRYSWPTLIKTFNELQVAIDKNNEPLIQTILLELVPEYKPQIPPEVSLVLDKDNICFNESLSYA